MNHDNEMYHMNQVVAKLSELNSIICHQGKWVNIELLLKFAKNMPELMENALEAQEYMLEALEFNEDIEAREAQKEYNHSYKKEVSV